MNPGSPEVTKELLSWYQANSRVLAIELKKRRDLAENSQFWVGLTLLSPFVLTVADSVIGGLLSRLGVNTESLPPSNLWLWGLQVTMGIALCAMGEIMTHKHIRNHFTQEQNRVTKGTEYTSSDLLINLE